MSRANASGRLGPVPVILVAVDGGAESRAALRWALDHAATTGGRLRVVTAYDDPFDGVDAAGAYWTRYERAERTARARAAEVIVDVAGTVDVDHVVAMGRIDRILMAQSDDASMIVLGTRARVPWRQAVGGSTTNRLTGQVRCTVVSVPPERTGTA